MPFDPVHEVLSFWFGESRDDAEVAASREKLWWGADPQIDSEIGMRFGDLHRSVAAGIRETWAGTADGQLALIVVLDQFSRMMYRGQPAAFACDGLARSLCLEGLERGVDANLRPIECVFFYLPLEHSESLEHQRRCETLFSDLVKQVPPAQHALFDYYVGYATKHREVVERFGRFPHRNLVLGRPSTREEIEFLKLSGSSF
ncbi:MAG: DUF924 family protein [Panacagrimonas sp.]